MSVLQENVELLAAPFTPQLQRLQHDVHTKLIPVAETVDQGLLLVVDAYLYAIEPVVLDALVERRPREPEEACWRVVEARLRLSSLNRHVDRVWHLRRQLVEGERRNEAEYAFRDALCHRDEVRVGERLERGDANCPTERPENPRLPAESL